LEGVEAQATPRSENRGQGIFEGVIAEKYAEQVFEALDEGTPITLKMTYALGTQETLVLKSRGGSTVGGLLHHHANAPVRQCLNSLVPASGAMMAMGQRHHDGS